MSTPADRSAADSVTGGGTPADHSAAGDAPRGPRTSTLPAPREDAAPARRQNARAIMLQSPQPRSEGSYRLENWLVFLVAAIGYGALGYWTVVDLHVVGFESLDRLNRALMVWHNNPPKLAAIGFDYPPLTTIVLAPLAASTYLARTLVALPVTSAIFAGVAAVALNSLLRRCRIDGPVRFLVLAAVAVNPMVALYGSNGAREMIWVSLLLVGVSSVVKWFVTTQIRYVLVSGLAFSVAALADYGTMFWALLAALLIGVMLQRHGAREAEVEGTVVGFASPVIYVMVLWTVFNTAILGNPVAWLTKSLSAVETTDGTGRSVDPVALVQDTVHLVWSTSPLTFVVLPLLLLAAFGKRNEMAGWLALCIAGAVVAPALTTLIRGNDAHLLMRDGLPILMLTVVGAGWLIRSLGGVHDHNQRTTGSFVLVAALLASAGFTWTQMKTFPYQNLEANFVSAVSHGHSQEGATTVGGQKVGIVAEQAMAGYIRRNITAHGSILTDNSQTYAVMLLSGKPELFFDRVDKGDAAWLRAAKNPPSSVQYLLLSRSTANDLLSQKYPEAAKGDDTSLQPVYSTDRYVLVRVPAGTTQDTSTNEGTS